MDINERLYELRKNNNWSQEELAEKLNVSRQTVSKWESSKTIPELEKLVKLSEIYNISLDELIKGVSSETISKENSNKKLSKAKLFIKKHLKKIMVLLAIIIVLCIAIFFINIARRYSIIYDFSKYYKERFQEIGNTKSGTVDEHIISRDLNSFTETFKRYSYYVSEDGSEKLLKITEYEEVDGYHDVKEKKIIEEIYIDFKNVDDNGQIDDVVKINKKTGAKEVINDYKFESPMYNATTSLNHYYGFICGWDEVFSDKEMAFDFDNEFLKVGNQYIWTNQSINNSKDNVSSYLNDIEVYVSLEDYKEDIKEEREIKEYKIQNTLIPDKVQVILPEE